MRWYIQMGLQKARYPACQLNVFDRFRCLLLAQPCNKLAATSHQLQHQRRAAEWLNGQASLRPIPASYMHPRGRLHPRPRYRGGPSSPGLDHSRSQHNRTRPEDWVQSSPSTSMYEYTTTKQKRPINAKSIHPPPISFLPPWRFPPVRILSSMS